MGNFWGRLAEKDGWWGLRSPEYDELAWQYPRPIKITHDPLDGFPAGRKPRVALATEEEMYSAKLPLRMMDYCAHLLIDFKQCRYNKYPFIYRCAPERHAWEQCEYDDYILRMKEAEREERLRKRDAARAAVTGEALGREFD